MANPEHLEIFKHGVKEWNEWRIDNPDVRPDLSEADLTGVGLTRADLVAVDLSRVDLRGVILSEANLSNANLSNANLSNANLSKANLRRANLRRANLSKANLSKANLSKANLGVADFTGADLTGASLREANLEGTILKEANLRGTKYKEAETKALISDEVIKRRIANFGALNVERDLSSNRELLSSGTNPGTLIAVLGRLIGLKGQFFYFELSDTKKLTPDFLSTCLSPYLNAVADIQFAIDEAQGNIHNEVTINLISQNSPISVSLEGADKAIQQIQDVVVPWRRKHQKALSRLKERGIEAEIGIKKSEMLERQAKATKDNAEAEKVSAEAAKLRAEAEKISLENEKLRLDLQRGKIELVLEVLERVSPNLSETDKIAYVTKLLVPLEVIISSELEIRANN
jgi:uncharacterized protein YjbI with pentapeptide repeats